MNLGERVKIEVSSKIDDDRPVYVSGSFCNWNPCNSDYLMKKIGKGIYQFEFANHFNTESKVEYKYNKGGWDNVELDIFEFQEVVSTDIVPLWRKDGITPFFKSSMPIIEILSESFQIPQLDRTRKIVVLLPSDYYKNTEKHYPVVYMHDAQNLYGGGSAYGNWEIDKRLSLLKEHGKSDIIIVAINHGEEDRQKEFSPYKNKIKGQGMKYANFIVRTLKPKIDKTYRTKPERQFTGTGGSSMGGLISIYAGMMYPETIGRLMVFSPSLWTSPKIYFDAVEFFNPLDTKIYLYGGGKESQTMLPNIEKLRTTIENQGFDTNKIQIKAELDPEGLHNEKRWGQEFPKALDWLYS